MRRDIVVEPNGGWSSFAHSEELVTWLWEHLKTWQYLNFTSNTSIWEHQEDGSTVYIAFADHHADRVVEMKFSLEFETTADESGAYSALQECVRHFELKIASAG